MDININKMNLEDLELIKDVLESEFDNFWSYNILKEEISSENSYFIVAKNTENEIVGFAGTKIIVDEADVMNIVVRKSCRKEGIGSKMLENLINYSISKNLKFVNLEVNENNLSAIRLYDKFAFDHIGIRKKYYNGVSDAIIMRKEL